MTAVPAQQRIGGMEHPGAYRFEPAQFVNSRRRQTCRLVMEKPDQDRADDEPGMDIDHHVALEVLSLDRAREFCNIRGVDLSRGGGDQFRNGPERVFGQPAAFLDLFVFLQHPVKHRERSQIGFLIQQLRVDLPGCQVHGQCVQLDHYLEVLKFKPGALPGSTALAQARQSGVFTPAHDAFWAAARKTDGDTAATRELIDVLLLHRAMDEADVIAGITAAVRVGAVSADVVAVEARRVAAKRNTPGWVRPDRDPGAKRGIVKHRIVSLTQRRLADPAAVIAGLPPDKRPLPTVAGYDQLLNKRTTHSTDPQQAQPSKEHVS